MSDREHLGIIHPAMAGPQLELASVRLYGPDGHPVATSFERDYEQWIVHSVPLGVPNRKRVPIGGRGVPRLCRVCLKTEADGQTFRKAAHIIPQGLGNRELVSTQECDTCNSWGGEQLEDDLLKLLSPMRALLPIPTRKGGAKHKVVQSATASSLQSKPAEDPPIRMEVNTSDDSITTEADPESNTLRVVAKVQPFSLMDVAKALGRMAFLALPDAYLRDYEPVRRWIRGDDSYKPVLTEVRIPGTGLNVVRLVVYRRRNAVLGQAPLIVALGFGLSVYFCYLPGSTFSQPSDTPLPVFGLSPFPPHVPTYQKMVILADVMEPEGTFTFTLRYQEVRRIADSVDANTTDLPDALKRLLAATEEVPAEVK